MIRRACNLIKEKILWIRLLLNEIRNKKPRLYDRAVKWVQFVVPFIGVFAPVLITNNWLRAILEIALFTLLLLFQWATYVNRIEAKDKEIQKLETIIKSNEVEIKEKKEETDVFSRLIDEDESANNKTIAIMQNQIDELSGFSHSIADKVKKISSEIQKTIDQRVISDITQFLQQSLNSLESILSEQSGKKIRSSIKLTINRTTIKTYARGRNNIESRGGLFYCTGLNDKGIKISANYAYKALVFRGQQFFAEGNLLEMHNRFSPGDVFYCEYGDAYPNIFISTIVIPIRVPVYNEVSINQHRPQQEILGILCIDCKDEILEWSADDIQDNRVYHIIASYADNLAILLKEYRNASR